MKKPDSLLKDYAKKLSNDDLDYLDDRFKQRLCGDYADIASFLSHHKHVDNWLGSAADYGDYFNMIDVIGETVSKEIQSRNLIS